MRNQALSGGLIVASMTFLLAGCRSTGRILPNSRVDVEMREKLRPRIDEARDAGGIFLYRAIHHPELKWDLPSELGRSLFFTLPDLAKAMPLRASELLDSLSKSERSGDLASVISSAHESWMVAWISSDARLLLAGYVLEDKHGVQWFVYTDAKVICFPSEDRETGEIRFEKLRYAWGRLFFDGRDRDSWMAYIAYARECAFLLGPSSESVLH